MAYTYNKETNVLRDSKGRKMYPVASWEKTQHAFYNAVDRAAVAYYENPTDENYERWQKAQDMQGKFDFNPQINGVVYAVYEDYKEMKDSLGAYAYRHGGRV